MPAAASTAKRRPPGHVTARLLHATNRLPRLQRAAAGLHGRLYERTGGRFLGRWVGSPVLVLETVGRRSGRRRATPVIYLRDGESFVVTPANAGAERTPAWWLNLRAAGAAVAVVGGRRRPVRARVAEGAERERLWRRLVEASPAVEHYRRMTDRELPVVVLEPEGHASAA